MQVYIKTLPNTGHAVFYFSFSDDRKQAFENLLRSMAVQLAWKEPGLPMLQQVSDNPSRSGLRPDELEKIVLVSIASYDAVYLQLDALDECPECGEAREIVLQGLERLAQQAHNMKILVTSRESQDVHQAMQTLDATFLQIPSITVDIDIKLYVASRVSAHKKLGQLSSATRALIESTISERADGMFRWAYCQLEELKKHKSHRRKYLEDALYNLAPTLDATYERMLTGIQPRDREEALKLLRWLVYARSPLSLRQLVEASIIDPSGTGTVDFDDRGDLEDIPNILSGLITFAGTKKRTHEGRYVSDTDYDNEPCQRKDDGIHDDVPTRLAHFSVKEYLESKRIIPSTAKEFHLEAGSGHRFLAHSCLTYLEHYSGSIKKRLDRQDLVEFPLLRYAAESWYHHSGFQECGDVSREVLFLTSEDLMSDWLLIHQPDRPHTMFRRSFREEVQGKGLYYASFTGLEAVVCTLLDRKVDIDALLGGMGNVLQAASAGGNEKLVRVLIGAGADPNAEEGISGPALLAASEGGHVEVIQLLLADGAEVNAACKTPTHALAEAIRSGSEEAMQLLLDAGANVNAQAGAQGTALRVASGLGQEKMVRLLLGAGAEVNILDGSCESALEAASGSGHEKIVRLLLDAGAEVNAAYFGGALVAASLEGDEKIVKLLLDAGAEIDASKGNHGTALSAASEVGHGETVQILLNAGANVNVPGGNCGTALTAASAGGHEVIVQMLLNAGANFNVQGGEARSALVEASRGGYNGVVEILLRAGADSDAETDGETALQTASMGGHKDVVSMLIKADANVNACTRGRYTTALHAAIIEGHEEIVQLLNRAGATLDLHSWDHSHALVRASRIGAAEKVQLLVDAGADVNAQSPYSEGTALVAACEEGHEHIVRMLLAEGADFNALCRFGFALQSASYYGHRGIVEALLKAGADVNAQYPVSLRGFKTAYEAAERGRHKGIMQVLRDAGLQESLN